MTKFDLRQSILRFALNFVGSAIGDTADTILQKINDQSAKLYEDRNILLTDGGIITWTGTQIQFTEDLNLVINSKIAGGAPVVIPLGSANVPLADGEIWYAVINRTAGTAVLNTASTLPAVTSANTEVFLLAKRMDGTGPVARLYWRSGATLNPGQITRLGTNTDVTLAAIGTVPNANGASLSNQTLNLQPANGSFGGVVSTLAQSFAGAKTFLAEIIASTFIQLNGSTSGNVKLFASAITTTYNFVFPPNAGTAGQFMQTNGAGVTTWATVASGSGSTYHQFFTASGNFVVPAGVTRIKVWAQGGGGGGGANTGGGQGGGSGGGGGGCGVRVLAVTPGDVYAVVIGGGGAGGINFAGASAGTTGGNTTFGGGLVVGNGGQGSQEFPSHVNGHGGFGGSGTGDFVINGEDGGIWNFQNANSLNMGGFGGSAAFGGGVSPTLSGLTPQGRSGVGYGSGGTGSVSNAGNGANGCCLVEWVQ